MTAAATALKAAPKAKRHKRLKHPAPIYPARTEPLHLDGEWATRVTLTGRYGNGQSMILDTDAWQAVKKLFGDVWTLRPIAKHRGVAPTSFRIVTNHKAALENSIRSNWPSGHIVLPRWLVNATRRDQHVHHINGDWLDLRRRNLEIRPPGRYTHKTSKDTDAN